MAERNFGTQVKNLKNSDPDLYERTRSHFGDWALNLTLGEIEHYHELNDPRSFAANRTIGDFTASGGNGPKHRS